MAFDKMFWTRPPAYQVSDLYFLYFYIDIEMEQLSDIVAGGGFIFRNSITLPPPIE